MAERDGAGPRIPAGPHGLPQGPLDAPLAAILGAKSATKLEKHLDLRTVGDLLNHFPRRYLNRGELTPIEDIPPGEDVTLLARVLSISTRRMKVRKGSITDVVVTDETGNRISSMNLTFFNALHASRQLHQGELAIFSGKVTEYNGKYSLTNPEFSVLAPEAGESAEAAAARPIPIYPATAKLRSWEIQAAAAALLPVVALDDLADPVPEAILRRERLSSLADAYRAIHAPGSEAEWRRAQDRFRYQEALVLQSALARRRAQAAAERATARPGRAGGLLDRFDAALPFTLTAGQQDVGATLSAEVASGQPMNRLLQGEVGSGKTVVALRAMLQVIDSGGQAALLAPTEVLAAQHYDSIRAILGPLAEGGMLGGADDGTRVALLTGSQGAAARKKALLDAASGEAGIVVGTHALLSETVQFFDLGLIVVDEQHRFGVEQRDVLRTKAARPPHLLVMTATPIPRTVAMTVFGDLETSVLRELPAGRAPISTHVVGLAENPGWVRRIWSRAREEIDAGHQVYVVCPRIGDGGSDAQDGPDRYDAPEDAAGVEPVSVTELLEQLQDAPALAGTRVEMLHGRMDPAEKSAAMARFAAGEIDVLVSTTVIEVGVDVHNATLMVIMDADRFGISQLHQLRGRVGRGGLPGTALLVTALEREQPGRSRLAAVAATTDGFRLAEEDLRFRREGDVLGASQSGGRSTLRLLRVLRDADIIGRAREDAAAMVARDADLSGHPALVGAIDLYLNPEKEVFLERG